ncbi:MAG: ParB/RepB/Spo0J family partition protein [Eubacterium sp.]|nr:ParB/RepB/Spo0J family partition protein [Eubacterium sp.]
MGRYANVNLTNLSFMNSSSLNEKKPTFRITDIPIEKIVPNGKNKYSIQDIEDLKFTILHNGLKQNLEVYPIGEGLYKLITGERRYTALKALVDEGYTQFSMVPCLVTDLSLNELPLSEANKELYAIITTNSEIRDFTDADRMFQVKGLKMIYTELQKNGVKLTGKMNDLIAKELNISSTQVKRYNYVEKHGTDELKEKVESGEINIRTAESVAHLTPAKQTELLKKDEVTSESATKEIKKVEKKKAQRKDNALKKKNAMINLSEASVINLEINELKSKMEIFNSEWNDTIVDETTHDILSIKVKQLNDILDFIIEKIRH